MRYVPFVCTRNAGRPRSRKPSSSATPETTCVPNHHLKAGHQGPDPEALPRR